MKPMLALPAKNGFEPRHADWIADHKLDGIRCLVTWDHGTITMHNRNEVDITRQFPDVERDLTTAFGKAKLEGRWIFDGELLAKDGVFTTVATRAKQVKPLDIVTASRAMPATFVPFDVIEAKSLPIITVPLTNRREILTAVLAHAGVAMVVHGPAEAMIRATKDLGLEGVILKDPASAYLPGARIATWVKIKHTQSVTCVATGYEPGTGARAHFGAMNLAMIDGQNIVDVGKVGTGFTEKQILALKRELDSGRPVVVEIECLNRTGGNKLRFPVYKGWRTDLSVADATVDQLNLLPVC